MLPPLQNGKEMRGMAHRVFVYGTLKSGFRNRRLLEGGAFLGAAATVPTYKMIETSFPVIMPDRNGKPVAGDLRRR